MIVAMEDHGALPRARPDRRRRRGRGVRQGRPLPRPRLPGRPGDRPARPRRRPGGDALPAGDARRASTSRSRGSRPRWCNTCARTPTSRVADVAASFQEAVVDQLRRQAGARRPTPPAPPVWCSAAAWPPTRGSASGSHERGRRHRPGGLPAPPRALHRQRGDDRRHRLPPARRRRPHLRSTPASTPASAT